MCINQNTTDYTVNLNEIPTKIEDNLIRIKSDS